MLTNMHNMASSYFTKLQIYSEMANKRISDYFDSISDKIPQGYFEIVKYDTSTSDGFSDFTLKVEIEMRFSERTDMNDLTKIILASLNEYNDSTNADICINGLRVPLNQNVQCFLELMIKI